MYLKYVRINIGNGNLKYFPMQIIRKNNWEILYIFDETFLISGYLILYIYRDTVVPIV